VLVVFDVDGTLVDSQALIIAAQRATFAAHGLAAPSRETSLSVVGLSLIEAFTALVGPDGPAASMADTYREVFHQLRADEAAPEPLFPGADKILRSLAEEGVLLAVATGKSRRGVAHLVEKHGWTSFFASIQTADDAPSKPHPAMLLQAMAEAGAEPGETVMIGDTAFDMAMARAAGATAVGATWGYHPSARLIEAGAGHLVDDFGAFADLLARLPGGPALGS
jgi:phosphoglycolate phosphatase